MERTYMLVDIKHLWFGVANTCEIYPQGDYTPFLLSHSDFGRNLWWWEVLSHPIIWSFDIRTHPPPLSPETKLVCLWIGSGCDWGHEIRPLPSLLSKRSVIMTHKSRSRLSPAFLNATSSNEFTFNTTTEIPLNHFKPFSVGLRPFVKVFHVQAAFNWTSSSEALSIFLVFCPKDSWAMTSTRINHVWHFLPQYCPEKLNSAWIGGKMVNAF